MKNTMELYKKILRDRIRVCHERWEKDGDQRALLCEQSYQTALDMFEYVEADNFECLTQFDYLGEEEGE